MAALRGHSGVIVFSYCAEMRPSGLGRPSRMARSAASQKSSGFYSFAASMQKGSE